ncbi:hypothetical protein PFISCL1PPCAC_28768, partial [Pristionchus fissidentatus]
LLAMGASAGALKRDISSANSRKIDAALARNHAENQKKFKILLLGGSECGKTTIFKQMRILHLNGFNEEMLCMYRTTIHRNALEAMDQLIRACNDFEFRHEISTKEDIQRFYAFFETIVPDDENMMIPLGISRCMERIWGSNQIQATHVRRFQYPLLDCAKYFLDDISRIGETNYIPTQQDIIYCRLRTVGITELEFEHKRLWFQMVDVGGQRTERRKWIHCFDNVDMLMYVCSLSDFDQQDPEDPTMNRMMQNFEIFKTLTVSEIFKKASIVLFLNKHDIFVEKLKSVPLMRCFHNYSGDNTDEDASKYVQKQFAHYVHRKHRFYSFTTRATDTDLIDRVFSTAVSHIVNHNLRATGIN